jgi:hypothetical protein
MSISGRKMQDPFAFANQADREQQLDAYLIDADDIPFNPAVDSEAD